MGDIALRGHGRALLKKGGKTKDMSKKHEGMESMAEEARETRLEKKGYKETKSGKMVKAVEEGVRNVTKKISNRVKENVKFVTPSPESKDIVTGKQIGRAHV